MQAVGVSQVHPPPRPSSHQTLNCGRDSAVSLRQVSHARACNHCECRSYPVRRFLYPVRMSRISRPKTFTTFISPAGRSLSFPRFVSSRVAIIPENLMMTEIKMIYHDQEYCSVPHPFLDRNRIFRAGSLCSSARRSAAAHDLPSFDRRRTIRQ